MYILESAHNYSVTATHRDIGEQSTGLALYFGSIMYFAFLLLALLVVTGLYPFFEYWNNVELSSKYLVTVIHPITGVTLEQGCDKAGVDGSEPSTVVSMSLGSACNDDATASYYSCPTRCVVEASTAMSENFCATHLPCIINTLSDAEQDSCCTEYLHPDLVKPIPEGVVGLQLVTLVIIFAWIIIYHKQQLTTAQEINARAVTVGDYTIAVSGLGKNKHSREALAKHMSHYGEVASIVYVKNIGTLLAAEDDLATHKRQLKELLAWKQAKENNESMGGIFGALFRGAFCGGNPTPKNIAKLEKKVEELQKAIAELAKKPVENIGEAFVTFNYEVHANNCFIDHRRGFFERILGSLGLVQSTPRFEKRQMSLDSPPEPCDVMWENYDIRGFERVKRNVVTLLVMVVCILIGAGLQTAFEQLRENERLDQFDEEVRAAASPDTVSPPDAAQAAYSQFLTVFSSFVIVAVNVFLTTVSKEMSVYQRFYTQSEFEAALMLKLTVVHVVNSIIVPAASAECQRVEGEEGRCTWYAPGGLVEGAFYLQLFNAFLPDLVAFTDAPGRLTRLVLARYAKTQDMMDQAMDPPQFILAEKYAQVCKTVALALVYGPVLPVSYLLALVGLFFTYFTDKFLALRRCQKPVRQQNQATERVAIFMNVMAFVQVCFSAMMWYDYNYFGYWVGAFLLWILYNIVPLNRLAGISRDEAMEDGGTGGVSYWANMGKDGSAGAKNRRPKPKDHKAEGELDEEDVAKQRRRVEIECKLLGIPASDVDVARLDIYHPPIPVESTEETVNMIIDGYKLFDAPVPGDAKLMPGQRQSTGGPNRVCPPADRAAANAMAMAQLDAAQQSQTSMMQEMQQAQQLASVQVASMQNFAANPLGEMMNAANAQVAQMQQNAMAMNPMAVLKKR